MAEHATVTPNGVKIVFFDGEDEGERRRYVIDGVEHRSVTTILDGIDKAGLRFNAEWLTIEGCLWLASEGMLPSDPDEAEGMLEDNRRRFWQVWKEKARRGHLGHEELVRLATGGELLALDGYTEGEQGVLRGAADWFATQRPQADRTEFMVASRRFGFAGRPDFYGTLTDPRAEGRGLVDYKTTERLPRNKNGKVKPPYVEHLLQLGGYEQGQVECGYRPSDFHALVRIDSTGAHDTWVGFVDPQRFIAQAEAHQARLGIVKDSQLPKVEVAAAA